MNKALKSKLNRISKSLLGSDSCFYAFAAFMTLVFFAGGSSRDDVQSLVILRPMAVLFGAYALTCRTREHWKGRLFPLYITIALLILMVLQSIPLPPSIWTELPGRGMFADIADLAGIEQPWRPLTLTPSRTLNSLFSLAVPITAIMLYLNLDKVRRTQAIAVIIVLAAVSAAWAALQLAGPARGPLYLYNITNNGTAVGLFANRNHQAIMLASTITLLGWYAASNAPTMRLATIKFYISISGILVIVPLIFVTGSRAGLVLMVPALVLAMILIYNGRYRPETPPTRQKERGKKKRRFSLRQLILAGSVTVVLIISALSISLSRSLAFDRLFGNSQLGELRLMLLPTLFKMIADYLPWGSGFGSFEHVYKVYEPDELLNPSYLNQAHNDWLQLPIEGGAPVLLIGGAVIIWFLAKLIVLAKNWRSSHFTKYTALTAGFVMLCFLAGSVGDYPLRVPSLIAVFVVLACVFNDAIATILRKSTKSER
tara:strand:- start:153 stop:1607 length:1455 start_codon:yes stop_codon:yes gene_type:complete